MIRTLKRSAIETAPIVGFDTEYTSDTRKLLCYQLWHGTKGKLETRKMTVDTLAESALRLVPGKPDRIILITYFSIAELQFLPVAKKAFDIREYGSRSLDVSFHSEKHNVILSIFDLARFFDKQSLANAALSVGLQKLEYDTSKVTADSLHDPIFRKYALHDARLCHDITTKLREEFLKHGVDMLEAKTPANTSARIFRREYVDRDYCCDLTRARYVGMRGDWGGRTETYFRGTVDNVHEYDISSAYPNAAISLGVMPIQGSWKTGTSIRFLEKCIAGIAHVSFAFPPTTQYPCIPVVEPAAQLYLLRGNAWCTFAEVLYALELGADIRVLEGWGYSSGTDSLSRYMSALLKERATATGARKIAIKLQANSLIGKFAQAVIDIDLESLRVIAERECINLEDLMQMTGAEQLALGCKKKVSVGSVFMPEWNALITGHVRAQLARAIVETGAVYSATDAIWAPKKWKKPIPGFELKRSGPAILLRTRLGTILTPEAAHTVHHSIWNRKAAADFIKNWSENTDILQRRYQVSRPRKFRESLKTGKPLGEWITETRTASSRWDNKRQLLPSGETVPWKDVSFYRKAIAK